MAPNDPLPTHEVTAPRLLVHGRARLPTRHGAFEIVAFRHPDGRRIDDVALVKGEVAGRAAVPTRLHSECLTGDVFGSLRCDCRDQLEMALDRIHRAEQGLLLYLRQEGRGIGIAEKIRAYRLQEQGLDTVEANLHLGFDDDLRSYDVAAGMLVALGVTSIELHTNNPRKVEGLRRFGIDVARRVALVASPRPENRAYLRAKRTKSGHLDV
ncbi:MAG: GTP cyclohydrolase II [Deltaproteobacteria bacterium]|nr:MAG: GTP cyclohydrolase II [Deltaproteobacteria bacterium]